MMENEMPEEEMQECAGEKGFGELIKYTAGGYAGGLLAGWIVEGKVD